MPHELIYNLLIGILYIGVPFLFLTLLITIYNSIHNIKDGIESSMNDLSSQMIQRNNEAQKLFDSLKDDKYALTLLPELQRTKNNVKRAIELRNSERISKSEKLFIENLRELLCYTSTAPEETDASNYSITTNQMNNKIKEITNQYNLKVKELNKLISIFPVNYIANAAKIKKKEEIRYE